MMTGAGDSPASERSGRGGACTVEPSAAVIERGDSSRLPGDVVAGICRSWASEEIIVGLRDRPVVPEIRQGLMWGNRWSWHGLPAREASRHGPEARATPP